MIDILAVAVLINMQGFPLNKIFFLVEESGIIPSAYGGLSALIRSLHESRTAHGWK
jgi:hypothetical protein